MKRENLIPERNYITKKHFRNITTVLLLLSLLTSCGTTEAETSADTAVPVDTVSVETDDSWRETSDEVGDISFEGRNFNVLYRDSEQYLREITALELTGDIINDAVFNTSTGETPGTNRLEITGSKGKLVFENDMLTYTKVLVDEREYTFTTNEPFNHPANTTEVLHIPEGYGEQHVGILKNFTNHILYGEPLLSPGMEGIYGLSIANAMMLSSWKNEWVEVENDGEEFWSYLQEKIKTSRTKEDAGIVYNTEGGYGN